MHGLQTTSFFSRARHLLFHCFKAGPEGHHTLARPSQRLRLRENGKPPLAHLTCKSAGQAFAINAT